MTDSRADSEPQVNGLDPRLTAALDRLLPGHEGEIPVSSRPFLARLPAGDSTIRARLWPQGTTPERVRYVHGLLRHLETEAPGLAGVPFASGDAPAWEAHEGAIVDLQLWLPGTPASGRTVPQLPGGHAVLRPRPLEADVQRRLAARVAELHARTEAFAQETPAPTASMAQVLRAVEQQWGEWRQRLRPIAPNYPPVQRWLRIGEQLLPAAEEALTAAGLDAFSPVVAHLDLWPGHVLLDGDTVRLLDLGSVTVASPMLDVAQLVTRFSGWTGVAAEAAIADYASVRPLTPEERRALPALAAMDLAIEAARLLRAGYGGELAPSSREASAARDGAHGMLESLEALRAAVIRAADPIPFAKRRRLTRKPAPPPERTHGDKPRRRTTPKSRRPRS